jgi:hypothetical protein
MATSPRTFLGIRDNDSDGNYETVFIFSSNAATQSSAASMLSSFGATEIVMLDGGGSTGLIIDGTAQINTGRTLPHALAVYAREASTPDYPASPSVPSNFQSYRAPSGAFEIQFPSNWKPYTQQDGSTIFAPAEGVKGNSITRGAMIGFDLSCDKEAMLMGCFEELLSKLGQSNTYLRWNEQSTYSGRLAGQESFATYMTGQTPTGYKERVRAIACRHVDRLAYVLFIAPDQEFQQYEPVFRRMQESLRLLTRGKELGTANSLAGTTWKVYEKIVRWEESEMSPITFLAGGGVSTSDRKLRLIWKQTGNRVEIRDTEMGWPEIYATLNGNQMTGSARLGMSAREFSWRAEKMQSIQPRGPSGPPNQQDWDSFWQAFRAAVQKRDRVALRAMMSPNFEYEFEQVSPNKALQQLGYRNSQGWSALDNVLSKGAVEYTPPKQWGMKGPVRIAPPAAAGANYTNYRAIFEKTNGRWRWIGFNVGD